MDTANLDLPSVTARLNFFDVQNIQRYFNTLHIPSLFHCCYKSSLVFSLAMMSSPLSCQSLGQQTNPVDWWNRSLRVRKPHTPNATHNTGRWETRERLYFLQGLRLYGKGRWKKISELISTR